MSTSAKQAKIKLPQSQWKVWEAFEADIPMVTQGFEVTDTDGTHRFPDATSTLEALSQHYELELDEIADVYEYQFPSSKKNQQGEYYSYSDRAKSLFDDHELQIVLDDGSRITVSAKTYPEHTPKNFAELPIITCENLPEGDHMLLYEADDNAFGLVRINSYYAELLDEIFDDLSDAQQQLAKTAEQIRQDYASEEEFQAEIRA